ncbi:MAG: hypothetical protein ACK4TA_05470 [Saprospiraceae bacterium]
MKIRTLFCFAWLLLLLVSWSCEKDTTIVEPAGLGVYFIANQSATTLFYKRDSTIMIVPGATEKIGEFAGFGIQALPSEGMQALTLYRTGNGVDIIALEQNPIVDTLWTAVKQDNEQYGVTHYTFTVTDAMIR